MRRVRLAIFLLPVIFLGIGCATIHADPAAWSMETATKAVMEHEAMKFRLSRSTGSFTAADLTCDENGFWHFYMESSSREGNMITRTYKKRLIKFEDVKEVRYTWSPGTAMFGLICAWILGPMTFNLEVVMKDGERIELLNAFMDLPHAIWDIFPLWLYPYVLIHTPSEVGNAIDWLRQRAAGEFR